MGIPPLPPLRCLSPSPLCSRFLSLDRETGLRGGTQPSQGTAVEAPGLTRVPQSTDSPLAATVCRAHKGTSEARDCARPTTRGTSIPLCRGGVPYTQGRGIGEDKPTCHKTDPVLQCGIAHRNRRCRLSRSAAMSLSAWRVAQPWDAADGRYPAFVKALLRLRRTGSCSRQTEIGPQFAERPTPLGRNKK